MESLKRIYLIESNMIARLNISEIDKRKRQALLLDKLLKDIKELETNPNLLV